MQRPIIKSILYFTGLHKEKKPEKFFSVSQKENSKKSGPVRFDSLRKIPSDQKLFWIELLTNTYS